MRSWNGFCLFGDEDDVEIGGTIVYTCYYYRLQYDDTNTRRVSCDVYHNRSRNLFCLGD